MIVGVDARPALFGRTGFGRVVRESLRALAARDDLELALYGASWRRPEPGLELPGARTARIPARLQQLAARLGFGVETVLGSIDVYHHTDLVFAPVQRTPQVLTIYDLVYLEDAGWHAAGFADRVRPRVAEAARASRAILVGCERVADAVLAAGLAPADKLHVVPFGCDHLPLEPRTDDAQQVEQLRARAGLAEGSSRPMVLVPGTREPRKNQAALVQAFDALDEHAELLLVGSRGWGCAALEARLARRDGRVGSVGQVDDAELATLLRHATVVAYPSFAEGFGLPVFEALRQGCAVLSSQGTPMADLAAEALELVEPRSIESLHRGLARLLREPARRAELQAAGPALAARYSWRAHAAGLRAVYASTLS